MAPHIDQHLMEERRAALTETPSGSVGALNLGEIDSRILRCEPEKSQDRRLRTGLQIEFFRGIFQIGVAKHGGVTEVPAPLPDEIVNVAGTQACVSFTLSSAPC